jgi:magnesium and cobalt transporter
MSALLLRTPDDRDQLIELLHRAHDRDLLDADATSMIEGVLQVAELTAADIMVPRARMDVIDVSQPLSAILPFVVRTGHSRFPVVDGDRDAVVGILHSKDLLKPMASGEGSVRELLRPAALIPETKRLNVLLRDFREKRNHLAIVVDEYGGTAGLVTIEDVLEQIVGDIDDEFDLDDVREQPIQVSSGPHGPRWHVRAITPVARLDETLGTDLDDGAVDTVGGLVAGRLGRVPRRGDRVEVAGLRFEVLRADPQKALTLRVERLTETPADA